METNPLVFYVYFINLILIGDFVILRYEKKYFIISFTNIWMHRY